MGINIFQIILLTILIVPGFHSVSQAGTEEKPSLSEGKQSYQWYCSTCHGTKGDGKGFNARNLDPRPANHTDIKLMNKRTDKELYDAISGGGRLAGKSTLMPPWGNTLNETQIKSLVLYLRELCGCNGD